MPRVPRASTFMANPVGYYHYIYVIWCFSRVVMNNIDNFRREVLIRMRRIQEWLRTMHEFHSSRNISRKYNSLYTLLRVSICVINYERWSCFRFSVSNCFWVKSEGIKWDERDILCLFNPSRDLFSLLHMRLPLVFLIFLHRWLWLNRIQLIIDYSTTQWSFIGQTIISYVENLERNDPLLLPIDFPLNWSLNFLKVSQSFITFRKWFNSLKIPILELYQAKIVSAQLLSPTEGFLLDFQNDTVSITVRLIINCWLCLHTITDSWFDNEYRRNIGLHATWAETNHPITVTTL